MVWWEEGHAEMGVEKNATCSKLCLLQVEFAWSGEKTLIFFPPEEAAACR